VVMRDEGGSRWADKRISTEEGPICESVDDQWSRWSR